MATIEMIRAELTALKQGDPSAQARLEAMLDEDPGAAPAGLVALSEAYRWRGDGVAAEALLTAAVAAAQDWGQPAVAARAAFALSRDAMGYVVDPVLMQQAAALFEAVDPAAAPFEHAYAHAVRLEQAGETAAALHAALTTLRHDPQDLGGRQLALRLAVACDDAEALEEVCAAAAAHSYHPAELIGLAAAAARADFETDAPVDALLARWRSLFSDAEPLVAAPWPTPPGRRPRLGVAAAAFDRSEASSFFAAIFAELNRRFEVIGYCFGPALGAPPAWAPHLSGWRDLGGVPPEAAAARIAADQLDLLLDWEGLSPHAPLEVYRLRPAPVIASGYHSLCSLGPGLCDWVLGDALSPPPDHADAYVERVWRLSGPAQPLAPPPDAPAPRPWDDPDAPPSFGALCADGRVSLEAAAAWARILAARPDARLRLALPAQGAAALGEARLRAAGAPMDRVVFDVLAESPAARWAWFNWIDAALDSFPAPQPAAVFDALVMGVPVVARLGRRWATRRSASLLAAAGQSDAIVADADAYVARALALIDQAPVGRDPALRARRRAQLLASPLCDASGYGRVLAAAVDRMIVASGVASDANPFTLNRIDATPPRAVYNDLNRFREDLAQAVNARLYDDAVAIAQTAGGLLADQEDLLLAAAATAVRSTQADDAALDRFTRLWAATRAPIPTLSPIAPQDPSGRPLRIGLAQSCFHVPAYRSSLTASFAGLAATGATLFAYDFVAPRLEPDPELRAGFAAWRAMAGLAPDQAAAVIAADELDVLIDMEGLTTAAPIAVYRRRPAPLIASWINCLCSGGPELFDGLILAEHTLTPALAAGYAEDLLALPAPYAYCVFDPPDAAAPTPRAPSDPGPIFGAFCQPNKISETTARLWARILAARPDARLYLRSYQWRDGPESALARRRLTAAGLDDARMIFDGEALSDYRDHLDRYGAIDVLLDPTPFNGPSTIYEALWQGVPVVTGLGARWTARMGATLLRAAGLAAGIAEDDDDYLRRALAFADQPRRDAAARLAQRDQVAASALCDKIGFGRALEARLRAWVTEAAATAAPSAALTVTTPEQLQALMTAATAQRRFERAVATAEAAGTLLTAQADLALRAAAAADLAPEADDRARRRLLQLWGRTQRPAPPVPRPRRAAGLGRPLRVGLLSRHWAAPRPELAGSLAGLAAAGVALYAYPLDDRIAPPPDLDLSAALTRWRDLRGLDDAEAAAEIAGDALDALIHLDPVAPEARLTILRRRPAPVIFSWLNGVACGAPGLFDAVIAAAVAADPLCAAQFCEPILYPAAPFAMAAFAPLLSAPPPAAPDDADPLLGVALAPTRITPRFARLAAQILAARPAVRLRCAHPGWADPEERARATATLTAANLPLTQVDVSVATALGPVDLNLEGFERHSRDGVFSALWRGEPVICGLGARWAGRLGAAMLIAAERADDVAADDAAYVARALEILDAPRLSPAARLRRRAAIADSPLCDAKGFGRALAQALRRFIG